MKIALIGATGLVGSRILTEALDRGHAVAAVVRNADKLPAHADLVVKAGDATDASTLASLIEGCDIAISAYNPRLDQDGTATQGIIDGVKRAGVARLLVVGGAGSLEVAPGRRLVDEPDFPAAWKEGALRTAAFLDRLRAEPALDWVFLSPAATLAPGARTGAYRVGTDQLLTDAKGESRISLEDYAAAMLDEAERPRHHRQRFTVAY